MPPTYKTTVTSPLELNHSELNKDFLLPLRSDCTESCAPTKVFIPTLTTNVLPVTVSVYTDASNKDYIRVNASPLSYQYTPGTHVMELQLSDPEGCFTKYSISVKVKNTKARLTTPVVIADFTLKMN